jgi:hypothetical protein
VLRIGIDLLWPAFHGLRDDGSIDLPPSPVRLLGALISGAYSLEDSRQRDTALTAIDVIMAAPPPTIRMPVSIDLRLPDTYTEGSWVPDKPIRGVGDLSAFDLSHVDLDTTSRVLKPQGAAALAGNLITYDIDCSDLSPAQIDALDAAAQKVTYFGRSQDVALLSVSEIADEQADTPGDDRMVLHPEPDPDGRTRGWTLQTRAWYATNYERTFSPDPDVGSRPLLEPTGVTVPLRYSPYEPHGVVDLHVVPLGRALAHWDVPRLLDHVWDQLRQGHPDRLVHWTLLPLTISASPHADGRCVGIAVRRIDSDAALDAGEVDAWRRYDSDLREITAAVAQVDSADGTRSLCWLRPIIRTTRTLDPRTWTQESAVWQSATPLRAFPDARVAEYQLRQWIDDALGVKPDSLLMTSSPAERWWCPWGVPDRTDGLGQWWATIHFTEDVAGPLVLGPDQQRGFGVFRPLRKARQ